MYIYIYQILLPCLFRIWDIEGSDMEDKLLAFMFAMLMCKFLHYFLMGDFTSTLASVYKCIAVNSISSACIISNKM